MKHCPNVLEYFPTICCSISESVSNVTFVSFVLHYYSKNQVLPVSPSINSTKIVKKFLVGLFEDKTGDFL